MKSVGSLIDLKIAIHRHDKILDDKIDEVSARLGGLDANNEALRSQNEKIEKFLATAGSGQEIT